MRFKLSMNRLVQTINHHPDKVVSSIAFKVMKWLQNKADKIEDFYIKGPQNINLVQYRNNALDDLSEIAQALNTVLKDSITGEIDRCQIDNFCGQMSAKARIDDDSDNSKIMKGIGAGSAALLSILSIILGSIPLDIDETFKWIFFSVGLVSFVGASVLSVFIVQDDKENFLALIMTLAQALLRLAQSQNISEGVFESAPSIPGTFFHNPNLFLENSKHDSINEASDILQRNLQDSQISH